MKAVRHTDHPGYSHAYQAWKRLHAHPERRLNKWKRLSDLLDHIGPCPAKGWEIVPLDPNLSVGPGNTWWGHPDPAAYSRLTDEQKAQRAQTYRRVARASGFDPDKHKDPYAALDAVPPKLGKVEREPVPVFKAGRAVKWLFVGGPVDGRMEWMNPATPMCYRENEKGQAACYLRAEVILDDEVFVVGVLEGFQPKNLDELVCKSGLTSTEKHHLRPQLAKTPRQRQSRPF